MNRFVTLLLLVLCGCLAASAQESNIQICVGFRVGSSRLDPSFGDNTERLSQIVNLLESTQRDSAASLVNVIFSGSASPEGGVRRNRSLAQARMDVLENYVRRRVSLPDSCVSRSINGVGWELLAQMTEASDMPGKEDALNIIRNVPELVYDSRGRLVDSRRKQLMELRHGRTWNYMDLHFFPQLRNACSVIITVANKHEETVPEAEETETETTPEAEESEIVPDKLQTSVEAEDYKPSATAVAAAPRKPLYIAVKTNMLFDVLALPNIGAEVYLGRNFSISGNWMYGWWSSDRHHRYWRAYGGDLAVRRWFGHAADDKPLTGHHLGVYGQILTYDFEFGGKGQMAGEPGKSIWARPSYAFGLEYGYSLPITRRLNIDFAVGVGYLGGEYYKYRPVDGQYVVQSFHKRHYFGPTKLEVSLVWLLGHGNVNIRKGGKL